MGLGKDFVSKSARAARRVALFISTARAYRRPAVPEGFEPIDGPAPERDEAAEGLLNPGNSGL